MNIIQSKTRHIQYFNKQIQKHWDYKHSNSISQKISKSLLNSTLRLKCRIFFSQERGKLKAYSVLILRPLNENAFLLL